jgi:hypothetical protein
LIGDVIAFMGKVADIQREQACQERERELYQHVVSNQPQSSKQIPQVGMATHKNYSHNRKHNNRISLLRRLLRLLGSMMRLLSSKLGFSLR